MNKNDYRVILSDIRSAHNVGSIFRTADALGISKIYLSNITPSPIDMFNRANKEISKTALGAEKTIEWEAFKNISSILKKLKKEGFLIVAIEQSEKSIDYKKIKKNSKMVFVLGNEVGGLEKKVLSLCDIVAEIPMRGNKESLNVAVSFGVSVFRILNV